MEDASKKLTVAAYVKLLENAYSKVNVRENPTVVKVTRAVYLIGILIGFILARNLPAYRDVLGIAILMMGVFLLSASIRQSIKKRNQKAIRSIFDRMLYQISEVTHLIFELQAEKLEVVLLKKDDSQRTLFYSLDKLTSYQWLVGGFLISNEEGIDFIIPEGIFKVPDYQQLHETVKNRLVKK